MTPRPAVDFVPIVLGNGMVRLEVRPEITEIDPSLAVNGAPGFRSRTVDTGVEMKSGQTLALAGLIQNRLDSEVRGIPWLADMPWVGAAFRRTRETENEVELLILVTPELVDALHGHEVPPCGPGQMTTSPCDTQLYWKGHIEVPGGCPNCRDALSPPPLGLIGPAGPSVDVPYEDVAPPKPAPPKPAPAGASKAKPSAAKTQTASKPKSVASQPVSTKPAPEQTVTTKPVVNRLPPIDSAKPITPISPSKTASKRPPIVFGEPGNSYDRANSTSEKSEKSAREANGPPSLIGPQGYDVIK